jgi:phage terminase large subunit GpA-like protein
MSKTESVLNIIGACLDDDPGPVIYVGPTRSNVEKVIEPRLMAMLKSAKGLWAGFEKGRISKTAKRIDGVMCRLAWAGSASELASQEAQLAVMDEVDRMAFDVSGEGSPIELVDARLATYANSKLILTSTPTEGNVTEKADPDSGLTHWELAEPDDIRSKIWRLWQEGTRFEWAWPCPGCHAFFIPRFNLLKWPEKSTVANAKRKAYVECPHCQFHIDEKRKTKMNLDGRFVAPGQSIDKKGKVTPPLEINDHHSFWISGLASPWKSFGQRAAEFLTVARSGDSARVQGVINTSFGELFKTGGAAPAWESIKTLGAGYTFGQFPIGPLALTCGVDVQKDRLVWCVRGWAYGMESWLIDYGEHFGNTGEDQVWDALEGTLQTEWGDLGIRRMAIDSGYRPGDQWRRPDHMVYRFCRKWVGMAVPTKGRDEQSKPVHSAEIDVKENGKIIKKGLRLWHIDSDYFKSWVHARLSQPPGSNGTWHLPVDISDDYCQQVTAEAKVLKASGKAQWVRIRKENHLLDCEALNVAAAHMLSLQTLLHPRVKTAEKAEAADSSPADAPVANTAPVPFNARMQQPQMWRPPGGRPFATNWRK